MLDTHNASLNKALKEPEATRPVRKKRRSSRFLGRPAETKSIWIKVKRRVNLATMNFIICDYGIPELKELIKSFAPVYVNDTDKIYFAYEFDYYAFRTYLKFKKKDERRKK
jgi:hypothetical protein